MNDAEFAAWVQHDRTVHDDWREPLPGPRQLVFQNAIAEINAGYAMLSVALDEAVALRRTARLGCACGQAGVAAELLDRLARRVLSTLDTLTRHATRFAAGAGAHAPPLATPLDADFFRSDTGRRIASWSALLHRALPLRTPRLCGKLRMLRWMVERLSREFAETATEIAECASIDPAGDWQRMGDLHSDLNTCLHELTVLFKSFLRALPAEDFAVFRQRLEARPALLAPQPGLFRAST